MKPHPSFLRRHAQRLAALVVIVVLYGLARLPALSDEGRRTMADRFTFVRMPLPEVAGPEPQMLRTVHPALERHRAWISAVGAAVDLSDLDGDGLPNDVTYVDTRTDQVIVAPVPGTTTRYEPFVLRLPAALQTPSIAPMGCVGDDLNEDGLIDLIVYYWGRTPVVFLRAGDGRGPLAAGAYECVELVPGGERWNTNSLTVADVDGDGHLDVIVGNYFQDGARILDAGADTTEEMQDSMSRAFNGGRNRILLWKSATSGPAPTVAFETHDPFEDDIAQGWTLAIGAADLDGDLLPELYFANDFGPDRLLHNRSTPGRPLFADLRGPKGLNVPNSKALGRDSFKGMGCDLGDLNDDGRLDIYVSNIADEYALQESHFAWLSSLPAEVMHDGVAPYVDGSEQLGLARSGWGWESRLADFDNDGVLEAVQATGFLKGDIDRWPELHELALGNDTLVKRAGSWPTLGANDDLSGHQHNPFFVRSGSGRYFDIAPEIGLDDRHVTRGIATADVDGDGDLDFAIANQWETSYFFRNDGASGNAFLGLDLRLPVEGRDGGRPAVGAAVEVRLPDGRLLVGFVDGGNGHSGTRSHQVHFGLGVVPSGVIVPVTVRWRDGGGVVRRTTYELVPGWHTIVLRADAGANAGGDAP